MINKEAESPYIYRTWCPKNALHQSRDVFWNSRSASVTCKPRLLWFNWPSKLYCYWRRFVILTTYRVVQFGHFQ